MATNNAINGSSLVTTFLASTTWTANTRTQYIHVYGWNGGTGGGGGGGGGGLNTGDSTGGSGAGGNGANGEIIVIEFF